MAQRQDARFERIFEITAETPRILAIGGDAFNWQFCSEVLPDGIERLSIDAASPMSCYRWVGLDGVVMGLERSGASAPYERI